LGRTVEVVHPDLECLEEDFRHGLCSEMLGPAYMFGQSIQQTLAVGQDKKIKTFKNTDHFGGEMKYFPIAY
jgi:hypothetical protein